MPTLERRRLPGLDVDVSAIGAGCWTIGGHATNNGVPIGWDNVDDSAAFEALLRAVDLGVNLFDTADVYGLGRSERLLGRLLRLVDRDQLVISSKVGYFAGTARHPYEPMQVRHQLATTLANLGSDYLDVYFLHSTDFGPGDRYLPGAVELLQGFRDRGLIRAIGMRAPHTFAKQWASATGARAAETTRWLHLFDTIQPDVITTRYNLLSPLYTASETDIFQFARQRGTGVLIKQALGQGLLLDRHQPGSPPTFSAADHRAGDTRFTASGLRQLGERMAPIRARYGDSTADLARIALRYALQHAPEAAVLVGFRNAAQLQTNVTGLGDPLREDEIAEIRAALHPESNTAA